MDGAKEKVPEDIMTPQGLAKMARVEVQARYEQGKAYLASLIRQMAQAGSDIAQASYGAKKGELLHHLQRSNASS